MRILIGQCLCGPARHAILAIALQPDTSDDGIQLLKAAVSAGITGQGHTIGLPKMNPWCGICGAKPASWTYEVGWSKEFANWDAALAELKESEAKNLFTATLMDMLDLSYDAKQRKVH